MRIISHDWELTYFKSETLLSLQYCNKENECISPMKLCISHISVFSYIDLLNSQQLYSLYFKGNISNDTLTSRFSACQENFNTQSIPFNINSKFPRALIIPSLLNQWTCSLRIALNRSLSLLLSNWFLLQTALSVSPRRRPWRRGPGRGWPYPAGQSPVTLSSLILKCPTLRLLVPRFKEVLVSIFVFVITSLVISGNILQSYVWQCENIPCCVQVVSKPHRSQLPVVLQ